MTSSRSLESLTAAEFRDVRGSRFRLRIESPEPGPSAAFEFELADVIEAAGSPSEAFRPPFSVLFHGPIKPGLPQGIYRLEHDQLGVLELFIVPIGPDEKSGPGEQPTAMRYEAVFG